MLELKNVKIERATRTILQEVSCQIHQGEFVALVGENGAGKSTLLHAIAGNLAYSGEISLNNTDIQAQSEQDLAMHRAVLTQHHNNAFAFGIPELIAMGRHLFTEPKLQCYEKVNHYIELLELNHLLDRNTQELSGGELQRVYFAKCLAQLDAFYDNPNTSLMLLDEPTSALDLRHQHRLLQLVKQHTTNNNMAVVAIHDLNLASLYADKVLLINDHKVLAYGTPDEVFSHENLEQVYQTKMFVSRHPTENYPMIFSEPKEFINEKSSFS